MEQKDGCKTLHTIMALAESTTGLVLLLAPNVVVSLLFATSLDTSTGLTIGRVAGAALLTLGIACWFERKIVTGVTAAMLFYNAVVCLILTFAGVISGLQGIALWPAVVFHVVMASWCLTCLRKL